MPGLAAGATYAAVFAGYGLHGPYFPVWLSARALSASEIAIVLSCPLLLRFLVTPLIGRWADMRSDRRGLVAGLVAVALVAALGLSQADAFLPIFVGGAVMMLAYQAVQPVVDATVGSLVRSGRVRDYGRLRLCGSISFAVVAVAVGFVLNQVGIQAVFYCYIGLLVLILGSMYLLPSAGGIQRRAITRPFQLWKRPKLLIVLMVVALINASQAMFYSFGSVHMLALGYPDWSVGLLWTVAVVAEVIVLWYAPAALRHLGASGLLMASAVCSLVRWLGMALDPPLIGTALLQTLHAGTLSCTYLGLMAFIQQLVEEDATARAQSASVTLTGMLTACMTLVTGPVYQALGGKAYLAAAILPALAVVLLASLRRRLAA